MIFKARQTTKTPIRAVAFAATVAACGALLGAGVAVAGSANSQFLLLSATGAAAVLALWCCYGLNVSLLPLVRFAFVAAFFVKAEINIFKLDEAEDPSGLNVSLALVTSSVLLAHDFLTKKGDTAERQRFENLFAWLCAALFFCAAAAVLLNSGKMLGWFSLASLATSLLIAAAAASHFRRRERLVEFVFAVAVCLVLTGATALAQYWLDFPRAPFFGTGTEDELLGTQSQVFARVAAFLRTPTEMGWVVSALFPLALAPLVCAIENFNRKSKILLAAATAAAAIAAILSLARGAWFGMSAATAIVLIGGWRALSPFERRARLIPATAAALLAILLVAPFAPKIYDRLTADDDGSAAIRLPLLQVAKRMIIENPFAGVGLGNYRAAMTKYDETGIFVSQTFPSPVHNVFAHVAAEIGVAGGVLFGLLIVAAGFENLRVLLTRGDGDRLRFALALAALAALVAWTISAMKEPGALGSARPAMRVLFLLFGLTFALRNCGGAVVGKVSFIR